MASSRPSMLTLGGVAIPNGVPLTLDGHDVTPLLRGEAVRWPNEVIIEHYGEGTIQPVRAIVKDRFTYIYVPTLPPHLYDLRQDPSEWLSLAEEPAYETVAAHLRARLFEDWDGATAAQAVITSQRQRMLIKRALETGQRFPWDFQPLVDAARRRRPGGPHAIRPVVRGAAVARPGAG